MDDLRRAIPWVLAGFVLSIIVAGPSSWWNILAFWPQPNPEPELETRPKALPLVIGSERTVTYRDAVDAYLKARRFGDAMGGDARSGEPRTRPLRPNSASRAAPGREHGESIGQRWTKELARTRILRDATPAEEQEILEAYGQISTGMPRAEAEAILGKPNCAFPTVYVFYLPPPPDRLQLWESPWGMGGSIAIEYRSGKVAKKQRHPKLRRR